MKNVKFVNRNPLMPTVLYVAIVIAKSVIANIMMKEYVVNYPNRKMRTQMAKYRPKAKGYESGREITTKSWFGSHTEMVVSGEDEGTPVIKLKKNEVVCKDDKGYYITYRSRLDNGMADPNRYSSKKRI